MKEPLRRYEINHPSRCVLDLEPAWRNFRELLKPQPFSPPVMHDEECTDKNFPISVSSSGTYKSRPVWAHYLQSSDVKSLSQIFPWSFLVFPSSCPVKCYVYDSWWSCIDPLWIHWSSMDPLLTHSGSTVHSGKPLWIPSFSISGSEVPTHFLQEPLDGSIFGTLG